MLDKEKELLIIAMEECSEVAIECSKILRFGFTEDKEKLLTTEVGDLLVVIDLMKKYGYLEDDKIELAKKDKINRLKKWSSLIDEE